MRGWRSQSKRSDRGASKLVRPPNAPLPPLTHVPPCSPVGCRAAPMVERDSVGTAPSAVPGPPKACFCEWFKWQFSLGGVGLRDGPSAVCVCDHRSPGSAVHLMPCCGGAIDNACCSCACTERGVTRERTAAWRSQSAGGHRLQGHTMPGESDTDRSLCWRQVNPFLGKHEYGLRSAHRSACAFLVPSCFVDCYLAASSLVARGDIFSVMCVMAPASLLLVPLQYTERSRARSTCPPLL